MDEFKSLVKLYEEINKIYLILCNLETNGVINNAFFNGVVLLLKDKLQKESELFKLFYDSFEYSELKEEALKETGPIFMRLRDYISIYEALNIGISDDVDDFETAKKFGKLYSVCSNNIFLIYLSILQECIDLCSDNEIKKRLISLKYYNSFTKHDMESSLVESNFIISRENYVNLYFVAETMGIDIGLCDEIILDCYLNVIVEMIKQLLGIKDNDKKDNNILAACINIECLLRACLALMSETEYNRISDEIMGLILELENNDNRFGVELINELVNNRKNDKQRIRKISTRIIND